MTLAPLQGELEQFVYAESRLLDERRFDEWLALLTDDVLYWVPNHADGASPSGHGVIVREDLTGLRARVARLRHPQNPTQQPPGRTLHVLTNVTVSPSGSGGATVCSNLVLYISKDQRLVHHPGKVEYALRALNGGWRIREKRIDLITNDLALGQLPLL